MDHKATVEDIVVLLQNPWFKVIRESLVWPNGNKSQYNMVVLRGFVAIIALRGDEIAVVQQYRPTMNAVTFELPCGGIEGNETPEEAARRETREELSHEASVMERLPTIAMSPGWCRNPCYPFVIREPKQCSEVQTKDQSETDSNLVHTWIPVNEWRRMIRSGEVIDGNSIAAWAVYWEQQHPY